MKIEKRFCMFLFFLTGILLSVMVVFMRLGGAINLEEFMSAGRVYDFSHSDLTKDSSTWIYQPEERGYRFSEDDAVNRYKLNGKEDAWGFLYIDVENMSVPSMEGMLEYYNAGKEKAAEQAICLTEGRNALELATDVPMYKMAIRILNEKGEFLSISSMQIRTGPSWYTRKHFAELFAVCLLGFLAVSGILLYLKKKLSLNIKIPDVYRLIALLQYMFQLLGDYFGERTGGKLRTGQRKAMRKLLFGLLFSWMIIGNVLNWMNSQEMYRYHVFGCMVLLVLLALVSWEKPLQKVSWKTPWMACWLLLWGGMIISDFFVIKKWELTGQVMLFAGSFLIFFWQNMTQPRDMLRDFLDALELVFLAGTVYCMLFRMKRPAIDYNGLFRSSEEFSMYGAFMWCMFLVELDNLIKEDTGLFNDVKQKKKYTIIPYMKYITGAAISFYFVLRSNCIAGFAASAIGGAFVLFRQLGSLKQLREHTGKLLKSMGIGTVMAVLAVSTVHIATKQFPQFLNLNITYENERLVTGLSDEDYSDYFTQYPEEAERVKRKQDMEYRTVWRSYIRRWNLFGHSEQPRVFRKRSPAYSGYIAISYGAGLFILVPYIGYQAALLCRSGKTFYRRKETCQAEYQDLSLVLLTGIVYISFCIWGNVDVVWGHPLWLSFYLTAGCPKSRLQFQEN